MHITLKFLVAAAVLAIPGSPLGARTPDIPAIPSPEDAPIAYMVDANSGQVLFAREADRRFMPASITKVMTTFLAFEWMAEGKISPQQWLQYRPETFVQWQHVGSTMFLPVNARVTVDTLLHGITTVSANDGSAALAVGVAGSIEKWTAAMNAKAHEIGMHNSHYATPNGWMDEGRTFVTARDLVTLGTAMIRRHPGYYRHFVGQPRFSFNGITQVNHDPISGVVEGADGIKTGFTNQAGYGFLGSAERNGRRLIMVVAGSPRGAQRNKAAREFIEWGFAAFEGYPLFDDTVEIASARVQNGDALSVPLRAEAPLSVSFPRGTTPKVSLDLRYEGPLRAPIAKGERVAELVIHVEGQPDSTVPLVAARDIAEAGFVRRFVNGIAGPFS